jgi:hypothetical protein
MNTFNEFHSFNADNIQYGLIVVSIFMLIILAVSDVHTSTRVALYLIVALQVALATVTVFANRSKSGSPFINSPY